VEERLGAARVEALQGVMATNGIELIQDMPRIEKVLASGDAYAAILYVQ